MQLRVGKVQWSVVILISGLKEGASLVAVQNKLANVLTGVSYGSHVEYIIPLVIETLYVHHIPLNDVSDNVVLVTEGDGKM